MDDDTMQTELVVALAEVRGEIRGLREATELRITQADDRVTREAEQAAHTHQAITDRLDAHHHRIDQLEAVKDRLWGGAAAIGLTSGLVVGVILLLAEWALRGGGM